MKNVLNVLLIILFIIPLGINVKPVKAENNMNIEKSIVNEYQKTYDNILLDMEDIILTMAKINPNGTKINELDRVYILNSKSNQNAPLMANSDTKNEVAPIYVENTNDFRFVYTDAINDYVATTPFLFPVRYINLNKTNTSYVSKPYTTNGYLAVQYNNPEKTSETGYTLLVGNPFESKDNLIKNLNHGDKLEISINAINQPVQHKGEYITRGAYENNQFNITDTETKQDNASYKINYVDSFTATMSGHKVDCKSYNYLDKVAGIIGTFEYDNIYYTISIEVKI